MKKRLSCLILALMLLFTLLPCHAFALDTSYYSKWPTFDLGGDGYGQIRRVNYFLDSSGSKIDLIKVANGWGALIDIDAAGTTVFTPTSFYTSNGYDVVNDTNSDVGIVAVNSTADYTTVQLWKNYDRASDRYFYYPVWSFSSDADDTVLLDRKEELWKLAPKLYQVMHQFDDLFRYYISIQHADYIHIGQNHPSDLNYLTKVATGIQSAFSIQTGFACSHEYQLYGKGWQDENLLEGLKDYWANEYPFDSGIGVTSSTITARGVEQLEFILDVVAPYFIDLFKSRVIVAPEITAVSVGSSRGVVDKEAKTVTVRLPASTDWDSLPEPVVETPLGVKATFFAGSLKNGRMMYSVSPWESATGMTYNGTFDTNEDKYEFGVDLSENWVLEVEEGLPYNLVTSFAVTVGGVTRYGRISEGEDGTAGTIRLNLPQGTDLSVLLPVVEHTGEYYLLDGADEETALDFTGSAEQPLRLVIYNSEYGLETAYDVVITADVSSENEILSYKIGEAAGSINGTEIAIEIPFATDLSSVEPDIQISEFAKITKKPTTLKEGTNTYTITAENGDTRNYTVTITRTPAATGCSILSFKYGGYAAQIDESEGSIQLTIPRGSLTTFIPTITLSKFATISPAATEAVDFSQPVQYTVTAQDGSTSFYMVTVTFSEEVLPNAYKSDIERVVANIISRYRTSASDDWEYMNIGFYDNKLDNLDAETIANRIVKLDSTTDVAMTNLDRKIMTLTANGIDCSNLAKYNDGKPFIDSKGNEVDDLVATLYNYSGSYTINGPAFALMALDMGNYTIPEDAVWTREKLLEVLLNHKYLSDGFGIDMVGGIMYAIGPYQDDPVYGDRVKAKMQEGLDIILESMSSDFSFASWGDVNSESMDWVMMGLCSMGIDCHTDPRFSDGQGHSMLQFWMDNFANVQGGYFHHTASLQNNAMATYEGCYASQWYLKFLENGGQGTPCYFYYHRFDFSRPLSTDASITSFTLEGKEGVIDQEAGTITVTLPTGTPLKKMHPQIELAEGATLYSPDISSGVTFADGIASTFIVQAEDGMTKKSYAVTVNLSDKVEASGAELYTDTIRLKNANILYDLDILEKSVTAADGYTSIELAVNTGVDTKNLFLSADISYGATCTPAVDGETKLDLTDWTTFVVKSGDGKNENTYRIKVVSKAQAEITSFRVQAGSEWYSGTIDNARNTITVTGVDDTALTSTRLTTEIEFTGRTCSPTSGIAVDFANAVTYTLGGDNDLASRSYTVTVLNKSGSTITANGGGGSSGGDTPVATTAKINSFSVLGVDGVIDNTVGTITVTLPAGTDVSAVAPIVTVPTGAVVSPVSGQVVNLTSPLTYTVTLGTESRRYTVSVQYERSISQQLWDKVAEESDVADHQTSYGHKFS